MEEQVSAFFNQQCSRKDLKYGNGFGYIKFVDSVFACLLFIISVAVHEKPDRLGLFLGGGLIESPLRCTRKMVTGFE